MDVNAEDYLRRLYWVTGVIGVFGFVSYFCIRDLEQAIGFALGALGSFGNLWLFDWVSQAIATGGPTRQRWRGGLFVARYLILFLLGYAIVNALGVKPLAIVLGLLASTAAVLVTGITELVRAFLIKRAGD